MPDVANLGVHIETTGADQAVAALRRVDSAVEGTRGSTVAMGAAMGAVSASVTKAFDMIASAAQGAVGAAGSLVDMNSKLEQASIAFTTMLGSGEAAAAFLKDLQQFAATTPFDMPGLTEASKRLLAFGFSSKEIIPILTSVGNAAAAMGSGTEGINRITTALGQMQAKGKLQAEEMLQLTEAGIPAWDFLAKKLNTDVAGAMDAVSKRLVDSKVFLEAFQTGVASRFGNMMEAQSHTFAGAMSTIKDTLGQLAGGAFKAFFDTLSGLADRLAQFAQTETVSIWAQDLQIKLGALAPLFAQLGAWLEERLPAAMSAAEGAAQGFVAAVQTIGPVLGEMAQNAGPLLAAAWERLSSVLGTAGAAFAAIWPLIQTGYGAMQQLADVVNDRLGAALSGLGEQLGRAVDALGPVIAAWWSLGEAWRGAELDAANGVVTAIAAALDVLGTVASTAFQSLQIAAVDAANAVLPKLGEFYTWLAETVPPALAALQESWNGFWSTAGPLIQAAWSAAQPVLEGIGSIIATVVVVELQAMKAVWDNVWGGIQAVMATIAPLIGQFSEALGNAMKGAAEGITAGLTAARPAVAEAATETGEVITRNVIQGVAPVAAAVETAVAPAAAAIAKVGTTAATAASAVTSLGAAGTTAATGLTRATMAAQSTTTALQSTTQAAEAAADAIEEVVGATTRMAGVSAGGAIMPSAGSMGTGASSFFRILNPETGERILTEFTRPIIEGAPAAGEQAGAALGRGVQTGVQAALPAISSAMQAALAATASGAAAGLGRYGAQPGAAELSINGWNPRANPETAAYLANHPNAETEIAARLGGPDVAHGLAAVDVTAFQTELTRLAEQERQMQGAERDRQKALEEGTRATQSGTAATQAATQTTGQLANEQMGYTNTMASSEQVWLDYAAGTGLATHHVRELALGVMTVADSVREAARAFAESAAQAWASAKAQAEALSMNQLMIAGFKTQVGLTYGQIYGNTGTQGGGGSSGVGGSNQGIQNLPPGNYYGLPVVSPVTKGSLRGYWGGGMIERPTYLTDMGSGRTFGKMAEFGPESIGGGGGTAITIQINASGVDALRDASFWDQAVAQQIRPALKRVGVKL